LLLRPQLHKKAEKAVQNVRRGSMASSDLQHEERRAQRDELVS
jgi:hypothetical protein